MYIPDIFSADAKLALEVIKQHPFAILTAQTPNGLRSVHVPFTYQIRNERLFLQTHIARANEISSVLLEQELLVHFSGPASYISPNWYRKPNHFPTWVYCAVHAYGGARQLNEDELQQQLVELIAVSESLVEEAKPWQLQLMPSDVTDRLKKMIIGIEIEVDRLDTCFKLNQHKQQEDIDLLTEKISKQVGRESQKLAEYMSIQKQKVSDSVIENYLKKYIAT